MTKLYKIITFNELKTIHSTFSHPTVKATLNLLRRAIEADLDMETKQYITKITDHCSVCSRRISEPRRFKFTIGSYVLRFNHHVQVDTMWIDGKPDVHMVDTETKFTAARLLENNRQCKSDEQ